MSVENYDVVVLGAGSGGYVAAIKSAQLGAKTAIIEKEYFGGTCLNVGCIPTKTLVKNAEILRHIGKAANRGINLSSPEIDMKKTIEMKNSVVKELTDGVHGLLKSNGIDIFEGFGKVLKNKTIEITKVNKSISFDKLIIATGSSVYVPPVPGLDEEGILTSTEILDLEEIPEHLVIIGGGVIGCEFATIFNSFGSKVTIVEMLPNLVPNMDKDVSNALKRSLKNSGVNILTKSCVEKVQKIGDRYEVSIGGNKEDVISADKVLVSVGRKANLAGLESLNLTKTKNYIDVDGKLETSEKDIYAIGDVTGQMMLAHVASAHGVRAIENALGNEKDMDLNVVPSCIYTLPEIGTVGITEERARELYDNILVGKFPMVACGKAFAMGEYEGFVKVIAEESSGKILGAHIFGPSATELIGEVAVVMKMNGTLHDIGSTIHAHPTVSESIMEAVHAAYEKCVHMPKPANKS